jgi:CHAD domain-containing protein
LRIQVKKMRYAAEFFSELFQNKKAMRRQKKFMPALERLQDGLGDLNDIAVDERLIASAAIQSSSRPSRFGDEATGFSNEWRCPLLALSGHPARASGHSVLHYECLLLTQ